MSLYHDSRPMGSPPPFDAIQIVTRVPGRNPTWKPHTDLRHAKTALAYRRGSYLKPGEIWQVVDGEWVQVTT